MSKYSNQKIKQNEEIMLSSLQVFIDISTDLIVFQKQLYSQANVLNRSIFKAFRKIRESIQDLYSKVSTFTSDNADFIKEKEKILQKQIQAMQTNIAIQEPNQNQKSKERFYKGQKNNDNPFRMTQTTANKQNEHIAYLQQQNQLLKSQLRRNDTEYQIQIKKYNIKYEQMLEEINYYRQQLEKSGQLSQIIDKLQVDIRLLQEVKQRDEQLIQNMAKKIRNYERERYGGMINTTVSSKQQFNHGSPRINHMYSPKSRLYSRLE